MKRSSFFFPFIVVFISMIVSSILTFIIMGKDAWLFINPSSNNQITIVTPEYRKAQWDALMNHPLMLLPIVIVAIAMIYAIYRFYSNWKSFNRGFK